MAEKNSIGRSLGISESNMGTATVFSVLLMIPWMALISWICATLGVKKYDGCAILGTLFVALPLTFLLLLWLYKKYIDDPEELAEEIVATKDTVDEPAHSNTENANISFFDRHAKTTFIVGIMIWTALTIATNIDENIEQFILGALGPQTDSLIDKMANMAAFFSGYVVVLFFLAGGWYGYLAIKEKFSKKMQAGKHHADR